MKRILLPLLVIGVLLMSACEVSSQTTVPEAEAPPTEQTTPEAETPPSETLKIAVFNDCKTDIVDTQVLINDELAKHIPIYNGYWADFGSYEVTNDYKVTIKVIRYHASGEKGTETEKTVIASGSSNMGFWVNEKAISIKGYPEVVLELVPAKIPEAIAVTPGERPEDVIPVSVSGFKFVEKSEYVKGIFEGEEYWAYSFFQPRADSKFQGKVDSLEIRVHKFKNETSAREAASAYAQEGTTIQVDGINVTLNYDEDFGEAAVSWQHGNLVILSDAIPPFEATTFDEQVLKDAVIEGVRATVQRLQP